MLAELHEVYLFTEASRSSKRWTSKVGNTTVALAASPVVMRKMHLICADRLSKVEAGTGMDIDAYCTI